ncbi:uncharacterized protein THITE_36409 [Thermothielavioides terrestris NRRL 8126]|uniref:Cytochrome b5 heme-binding domain-containing protein n=1 Tax=Thermothielavioides terrestris (strain ATCC 38088 / NRRL 8126) TaxID=578455 RepID=G2R069_THETT|nr:uncharacterized protein THITE_36409 [Thermothielavioides terrestris NRRL 8126]AEO66444.1 hypothetical protein THITE_36409 [Thermothielavioides terrestris NRRL 8126]
MYCAIDGEVYDLGRYLHSHPGGAAILRQYAGRDATAETVNDDALFERLAPYTGGDATAALKNDGARESLSQLLGRDDLICAKLARATRRQITPAELRKRSYLPRKAERQARPRAGDKDWRAWVSAAEEEGSQRQAVYDVTPRKAQVLSSRPQSGRQSIAGLKRRMSALEDSDGEFTDRSKRFRARSWR